MKNEQINLVRQVHDQLSEIKKGDASIKGHRLFQAFAIGLLGIVQLPGISFTKEGVPPDQDNIIAYIYDSQNEEQTKRIAKATSQLNELVGLDKILCANTFKGDYGSSTSITEYARDILKNTAQPYSTRLELLANMFDRVDKSILPTKLNGIPSDFWDIHNFVITTDISKQYAWLAAHNSKTKGLFEARAQKIIHLADAYYGNPSLI